ncbi:TonB-dependent receptor; Outer membrane receptor for ferrienterochelin and colicins, partial [hydrothermal vent metagenome]
VQAQSERNIIGLYGQYQKALFESTFLTLGLRYDDFSDIGSQVSPRLGLVQALNAHHSLKLLYGEAFRAPSESELNLLNNPVLLGNPDLKPETVQTWDIIWVGQWSQTGISLGYFENHFDDSIVQTDMGNGTAQFQNIDQDPIQGTELELSHELNKHWLLRASFTYITVKPDLSFREADQLGSVTANYQYNKLNASLIAAYTGERESSTSASINNRINLDDYWLLFAKLQYDFTANLEVFIQAKNLLDENYLTPTASSTLSEGIPNRGRELLAGMSWKF